MDTFEVFESALHVALNHLYDPAYERQILELAPVLGCIGLPQVQNTILQDIERMCPDLRTPKHARSWRIYQLLRLRYAQQITQRETASQLGVDIRYLRREQNLAIQLLARHIWEQRSAAEQRRVPAHPAPPQVVPSEPEPERNHLSDWLTQAHEELTVLQQSVLDSSANVNKIVAAGVELVSSLANRHGVAIQIAPIPSTLTVAIPSLALRQIVVQALLEIMHHLEQGTLQLETHQNGDFSQIVFRGGPITDKQTFHDQLIREMVSIHEGQFTALTMNEQIVFDVSLPTDRITVLVVDDNPQLSSLFQRYVRGTRYKIVPIQHSKDIYETIEVAAPDIIVLDIMLSDVDGWELLSSLRVHPDTQSIPVIICSVVREEELALELGARLYLPKPVRRQSFLKALEDVSGDVE